MGHLVGFMAPTRLVTSPLIKRLQACFTGGMFGLASRHAPTEEWSEWYLKTGAAITATCHESYRKSPVGIGPEAMLFNGGNDVR
jgi:mannosyl-oligosaccharide alpha-1,2-mannosidase